jgi:hypothetical protein
MFPFALNISEVNSSKFVVYSHICYRMFCGAPSQTGSADRQSSQRD